MSELSQVPKCEGAPHSIPGALIRCLNPGNAEPEKRLKRRVYTSGDTDSA